MKKLIYSYIKYVLISLALIFIQQYVMLWMGMSAEAIVNTSDIIMISFPVIGTVLDAMEHRIRNHKNCDHATNAA